MIINMVETNDYRIDPPWVKTDKWRTIVLKRRLFYVWGEDGIKEIKKMLSQIMLFLHLI